MKSKLLTFLTLLLLLSVLAACGGGGGSDKVTTPAPVEDTPAECFDRTYNECRAIGNGPQICADFANLNCGTDN